jgi:hypothetical protein
MVDNLSFLSHAHHCINCRAQINMEKVKQYIHNIMRYEHKADYLSPSSANDPVIVGDYGNEVEIICSLNCMLSHYNSKEVSLK